MKIHLLYLVILFLGMTQFNFSQENPLVNEVNLADLKITIKRDGSNDGCLNCSPAYVMSIDGNGIVNYEGFSGINLTGKHTFSISAEQVEDLLIDFKNVKFFSLNNNYTEKKLPGGVSLRVSHANATTITLRVGGKIKSVYNFFGAPDEFNALQEKVDKISKNLQQ